MVCNFKILVVGLLFALLYFNVLNFTVYYVGLFCFPVSSGCYKQINFNGDVIICRNLCESYRCVAVDDRLALLNHRDVVNDVTREHSASNRTTLDTTLSSGV